MVFIQSIIVTRTLGVEEYGIWGIVVAFCQTIKAFLSFTTLNPLTRYFVEYKKQENTDLLKLLIATALLTDLIVNLIILVFIIALSGLVVDILGSGEKSLPIYWFYSGIVFFTFIEATWYTVNRDLKKFKLLAIFPSALAFSRLILLIILWVLNALNLTSFVIVNLLVSFVQFIMKFWNLKHNLSQEYQIDLWNLPWKSCWKKRQKLSGFWQFMKITYLSTCLSTFMKNADVLLLGYYQTVEEVGIYRLAKSLISLIRALLDSLSSVIYQDFNEVIIAKQWQSLKRGLIRITKLWLPTMLTIILLAIFTAKPIIQLVYGEKFAISAIPFNILFLGVGLQISFFWLAPIMDAMDLAEKKFKVRVINTIWYIPISIIATQNYGYIGAAFAVSIAWGLECINLIDVVKKFAQIKDENSS